MKVNKKCFLLSEEELRELLEKAEILEALEQGGVDNWIGYDDSRRDYLEEEGFNDWDDLVDKAIENYSKGYYLAMYTPRLDNIDKEALNSVSTIEAIESND